LDIRRQKFSLMNQGAMLRPVTERLLHNAGIDAGMRVLGVDPLYGSLAELLQTLQPQLGL
jgi:hypothetical protein